jgi:hypothetical protein
MRKLLLALAFTLLAATVVPGLQAQSTSVSGQITDAGSQAWDNGTFQFLFVPNPQYPASQYTWTGGAFNPNQPITGTMNGSGAYSVSIPSNTAISPINSQWLVKFCPQANPAQCYTTAAVTITGSTQTLNATPPAIQVQPGALSVAYSDSEIVGFVEGSIYWNVTIPALRIYDQGAWVTVGSGGGGGGTVTSVSCVSGCTVANPTTTPAITVTAGGSGTVTSFSSGNLSPLFTTSVATATSTPALSFTASTAAQNAFLSGPSTGGTGAYSFRAIVLADLPSLSANTVLGALTATTPSGLALPSCSGASNALIWTSGTGFGCNSITAGSANWSTLTGGTNTASGFISAPTSTTVIPWIWGCPLSITVDCVDWTLNGSKVAYIDSNGHFNIQTLNLPGSTTYSILSGNSTGPVNQTASPAGPGMFDPCYVPTSSTPVALTTCQVGVAGRAITGAATTATILYTDAGGVVDHDQAGSASVTITLPTATTLGNPTFGSRWCNQSTHADTMTPTTWTIQVGDTAAAATAPIAAGTCLLYWVDPNSSTNWLASGGTAAGGSGLSGQTTGCLPLAASATTSTSSSSVCDNGTTVSTTEPLSAASISTGSGCTPAGSSATGGVCMTEAASTGWTPTAGFDYIRADSSTHTLRCSQNGGAEAACVGGGSAWSAVTAGANAATGAFSTAGPWTFSAAGAASTPGMTISGAPYTGGSATTNFPQLYVNSGAAPTTFNANGEMVGVNAPSGFTGYLFDGRLNGGASIFSVNSSGAISASGTITGIGVVSTQYLEFGTNLTNQVNAHLIISTTAPTISTHFNTSGDSIAANSTMAFTVTAGTGTGTSTGVLTMPAASTAWICSVNNMTAVASNRADNTRQSASTTTSVTVINETLSSGAAVNFTNGDVINFQCSAR